MNTEFLKELGLSDEQIEGVEIVIKSELEMTISENENIKAELTKLKSKIASDEAERERKSRENSIITRYDAVCGERRFKHELVKQGVFKKFEAAIDLDESKDKSDEEIFNEIIVGQDYFAPERPAIMQSMGVYPKQEPAFEGALRRAMGI